MNEEEFIYQVNVCLEERMGRELSKTQKNWKPKSRQRLNEFIVVPVRPNYAAELNVTDSPMDHAKMLLSKEIIRMSITTISFLQKRKRKIVPFPLFLGNSFESSYHPCHYVSNILGDKQNNKVVLHIIGHSFLNSPKLSIGRSISSEWGPEELAMNMTPMIQDLDEKLCLGTVNTIEIVLHFCQSAAEDPHHVIIEDVKTNSFAGRFYLALRNNRDWKIHQRIVAFAGFYVSMSNGSGIRINDINKVDLGTYEKFVFTIENGEAAHNTILL